MAYVLFNRSLETRLISNGEDMKKCEKDRKKENKNKEKYDWK